jgi:hypothetical protein
MDNGKKIGRKELIVLGIFILFALALWLPDLLKNQPAATPTAQQQLTLQAKSLYERYKDAGATKNDIAIDAIKPEIERFLHQTNRRADNWQATIEDVRLDAGKIIITATFETQKYLLILLSADAKNKAAALTNGDQIIFTGGLSPERSLTINGGLTEQEFMTEPDSISIPNKAINITQPN